MIKYESMLSDARDVASLDESFKEMVKVLKALTEELHGIRQDLQKLDQEIHAVHLALARKSSGSRRKRRKRYEEEEVEAWSGGSMYG